MKCCSRHSSDLMDALRKKGLAGLIRPERARLFAQRWLDGAATREEFDPYVVAALEIMDKCKAMNIYVLQGACPLCAASKALHAADAADKWIDNVSDLMLLTAHSNNLKVGA